MEIVALIPAVLCLIAVFTRGTQFALQNVVLPSLFLLPTYFTWTARPLPSIDFVTAALIGIGIGMAVLDLPRWRFSRTDLWLGIFLLSTCYTDYHGGRTTDSAFALFNALVTALVPYMAGKLLIEHAGARIATSRRIVWLMAASAFISTYEYFAKSNPFAKMWNHFFPSQWAGWITQIRWGFGRVAGPFSQSELAGIIFSFGFLLALWLAKTRYEEKWGTSQLPNRLKHARWLVGIILLVILMTQARGPWIGTILALSIAFIGRGKRALLRAMVVTVLIAGVVVPTYLLGKDYLSGPRTDYGSERETAQYRAELLDNYLPVAIAGGPFGWGTIFPRIHGQTSIDNQYLYSWVVQGWVGAGSFCLLLLEAAYTLIRQAIKARSTEDRHFVLTLLGIIAGLAFTIATVFLGAQSYPLCFLLIGWSQAVGSVQVPAPRALKRGVARAAAEPVLLRVYT